MREKIAEWLQKWYQGGCNWNDLSEGQRNLYRKDADQILALLASSEGELISDEEIETIANKVEKTEKDIQSAMDALIKRLLQAQARHTAQQKNREIADIFKWLQDYAIRGGKVPLNEVIDDLKTHSKYAKYLNKP